MCIVCEYERVTKRDGKIVDTHEDKFLTVSRQEPFEVISRWNRTQNGNGNTFIYSIRSIRIASSEEIDSMVLKTRGNC